MKKLSDAERAARLTFEMTSGSTPQSDRADRETALHEKMAKQKAARLERDAVQVKGADAGNADE